MSSLKAFLKPQMPENKEVFVSNRFLDEDGKVVPFVIKPITQKENEQIIKKFTREKKSGGQIFNQTEYVHALTAYAVVEPDLKSSELQKMYGVLGEAELLKAMLLIGEFGTLAQEVQSLSGLDETINEDIEKVKN